MPDMRLLTDYLAGESTPEERATVERWLGTYPRNALMMRDLRRMWEATRQQAAPSVRTQAIVQGVRARIAEASAVAAPAYRPRRVMRAVYTSLAVAVVIVGLVMARHDTHIVTPERGHVYATSAGQRASITLTDGSRVMLAPRTRLIVAKDFGAHDRRVMLQGEAYFEVTAASQPPFVIYAGGVTTRVLGTAFDIRHYATDSTVRVTVVSGKVVSAGRGTPVTLTAGTVARVTDTTAVVTDAGDVSAYTDWTAGRLVFNDVPVSAMLATVGQWYGYQFRLTDSTLATRHIKATFNLAARDKTLLAIQSLLDVTMTFEDSTVTLRPRRTRGNTAPSARIEGSGLSSPSREVGK